MARRTGGGRYIEIERYHDLRGLDIVVLNLKATTLRAGGDYKDRGQERGASRTRHGERDLQGRDMVNEIYKDETLGGWHIRTG